MSIKRLSAIVHGRVQGVGFRNFIKVAADSIQLVGFTRNMDDGTVAAVAEGSENQLLRFELILNKGPLFSSVVEVEISRSEATGEFSKFTIDG